MLKISFGEITRHNNVVCVIVKFFCRDERGRFCWEPVPVEIHHDEDGIPYESILRDAESSVWLDLYDHELDEVLRRAEQHVEGKIKWS